jgi:type II secretion system protein H
MAAKALRMTSGIGRRRRSNHVRTGRTNFFRGGRQDARRHAGFTLIELILVMTLLAMVFSLAAPSLSRFFRSRSVDSEARRFLSLTRAAQSRAVTEGVPMILWLETKQRTYGLNADRSFLEEDPKAEQFSLDATIELDARFSADAINAAQSSQFKSDRMNEGSLYVLRFTPDGFIALSSPETVIFRQKDNAEMWVTQSRNRLNYEIQTRAVTTR